MNIYCYNLESTIPKSNLIGLDGVEECTDAFKEFVAHLKIDFKQCTTIEEADVAFVPFQNFRIPTAKQPLSMAAAWEKITPMLRLLDQVPHFTLFTYVLYQQDLHCIPSKVRVVAFESEVTTRSGDPRRVDNEVDRFCLAKQIRPFLMRAGWLGRTVRIHMFLG